MSDDGLTNKKFIRKQANCGSQVQINSRALLGCLFLLSGDKIDRYNPRQASLGNSKGTKNSGLRGGSVSIQPGSCPRKWGNGTENSRDGKLPDSTPKNSFTYRVDCDCLFVLLSIIRHEKWLSCRKSSHFSNLEDNNNRVIIPSLTFQIFYFCFFFFLCANLQSGYISKLVTPPQNSFKDILNQFK